MPPTIVSAAFLNVQIEVVFYQPLGDLFAMPVLVALLCQRCREYVLGRFGVEGVINCKPSVWDVAVSQPE